MSTKPAVSNTTPATDSVATSLIFGPRSLLRLQRDLAAVRSLGVKAPQASAAALHPMASPSKVYSFTTVDYPGAAFTEVLDSNGTTDVGIFVVDPMTPVTEAFTHSGNNYEILNLPGSSETILLGINSAGTMAGAYSDLSNKIHGFINDAGVITNVDFPGSTQTLVAGINDAGDIVGIWLDAANHNHGFVSQGGIFTAIDYPSATITEATGINASGQVAGNWTDAMSVSHGFIWSGGVFTNIDFPGAKYTVAFGINDSAEVAGYYADASSVLHGFLYQSSFTIVDVAGATGTLLTRVRNDGNLAGVFTDSLNADHGVTAH